MCHIFSKTPEGELIMASSEKERRNYVELYTASGLSPAMFCKQHSLKVKTFYKWLKRYPCLPREPIKLASPCTNTGQVFPSEQLFMPLKITDFKPEQTLAPEGGFMTSLGEPPKTPPLTLCFKTPHFSLDVCLHMDDHFSDFKLMLQAFQELK
jgi:hypothetical protein